MRKTFSILDTVRDSTLFRTLLGSNEWHAWRAFLSALFALAPEDAAAADLIRRCTGRTVLPKEAAREAWCIVGRRGGKSRIASLIAVYLACFRDYRRVLAPGERGVLMVIAADRKQSRVVKRYISALLRSVPMLKALIAKETKESIQLTNGIDIEIHTSSFRAVRGYTVIGAICDEMAFWPNDDAADPDTEILNALRPAMASVPQALLVCISSPYARRGEVWRAYEEHFAQDDSPVLVWQADTRTMNPTIPQREIDAAYARDEASASAEYGAQFRRDVERFLSREVVQAVTAPGRHELPPVAPLDRYRAFVDPSGGAADSMTLAIAHTEVGQGVLDLVRETTPPFSPEATVTAFVAVLKAYGLTEVTGDRYAGEWPREQFRKHGIEYRLSARAKSELYRDVLPMLNSGRVELLDHARLRGQFLALERRTARGGRDSIDHAPRAKDDVANAVAGVLTLLAEPYEPLIFDGEVMSAPRPQPDDDTADPVTRARRRGGVLFPCDF